MSNKKDTDESEIEKKQKMQESDEPKELINKINHLKERNDNLEINLIASKKKNKELIDEYDISLDKRFMLEREVNLLKATNASLNNSKLTMEKENLELLAIVKEDYPNNYNFRSYIKIIESDEKTLKKLAFNFIKRKSKLKNKFN